MNLPEHFDFTQSNLQDYIDCPYRFFLRYILRTKWPALVVDDALTFEAHGQAGARFHRLVQQFLLGLPQENLERLAESDPDPNFILWWNNFLAFVPPWLEGQRFVEMVLICPIFEHRFLAKYDLILLNHEENRLWIIDWKTSQKLPKKEWLNERIQTRLYRFVLTQAFPSLIEPSSFKPGDIGMKYWFAAFPESPILLPYDQQAFDADKKYLTGLIEEILQRPEDGFEKTTDIKKCRYCVYRSHCNRGVEAGDFDGFEDFEMADEGFESLPDFDDISEIKF
jgi:hypothetical protein